MKDIIFKFRNKIVEIFGNIKINKYPLWVWYKPYGYKVRGEQVRQLLTVCKPGDVLLRGYNGYLSSQLIGEWSHIGLILNDTQVIHSLSEGVIVDDILNFFRTDRIIVLRPKLNKKELANILKEATQYIGRDYDFGFSLKTPNELYCTELLFKIFKKVHDKLGIYISENTYVGFIKLDIIEPVDFLTFKGFSKIMEI